MQPFRRPLQRPSTSTPRDDHDDASATHDANTNHASKTLTVDTGTLSPLCSSTEEASTPAPMSSAVSSLRSPREGTLPYDGSGSPSRASINTPITNRTNANTTIHSSSCNSVHEEEQPPQRSSGNDSSEEGGVRMSARERVVKVSEEVVRLASPPPQGKGAKKKKGQAPSSSASSSRSSSSARPVANKSKTTPPRTTSPRGARAPTTKTSKSITPILSSRPNSASPVDVADVQALITNGLSGQRPPRGRRPPLHASASNNSDQKEPAAVSSPTRCEVENDVGAWMESSTDATRDRQSLEALREQLASGLRLSSSSSSSGSVRGRRAAVPHYAVATNEAAVGRLRAVDVLASSTTNSAAASITTAPPQRDAAADATHNNSDEHHDDGIRSSTPPSVAASDHNAVSAPSMMEAPTPPQQPPLVPADVRLVNDDVDGQGPLGRQTTPPFGTSADRLGISMSSSGTELLASEHILPHSGSDILASFNTLHSTVHPPDDAVVVVPSTATFATSSPPRMDELDGSVGGRRHHPPPMDSQRKTSNHHQHDDPYARAVQQHLDENDQQRFRPKGSCDSELVSATLRPQSVLEMDGGAATTSSRPTSSLVPTTSTITLHGSNKTSSSSSPKATAKTATSSPDVVVNAQSGTPHQHGSSSSFHDDDASNTMTGREKKHDRSSSSAIDAASSSTPSPPLLPNDAVHAEDVDASTHQQPPTHRGLQAALLANRDPHLRTQRQELSPHGDDVVGAAPIHIRDNNNNKEDEENMLVVYPHSNKVGLHHRNTSNPTQFRSASVDVAKASSARRHHMDAAQTTSPHDAHHPRASSAPSSPLRRKNTPTPLAESRYSGIAESPSLNSIEVTTQKRNTATNVSHNNNNNNNTHVHERPGSKTRVYGARLPAYKGPSASGRSQKDPSPTETTPPTSAKDARRDVVDADAAPRLDGGSSASQHQDSVQEKKHPARSPSTMANTPLAPATSTKNKTMKNANKMDDHHRGDGTPRAASLPVRGRTKPLSAKAKKTRKGVDDDAATPTPHGAPSPSRRASTQPPPSCQLIDLYTNDDGWINPHHLLHRPPNSAEMSAIWKNHPGSDSVREFVSTSARDVLVDVPIPEATEEDDAPAPADTSSQRREASSSDASIVGVEVVGDVQHHDAVDAPRAGSSPRPNKTPKKQPSSASRSSDVAQPTCASPTKSSQPTTPRTSKPKNVEDPTHQRRRRRRNPPPHDGTPTTTTSPSKPTVTAADEPPPNNDNNNNNDGSGDEDEVWIDPTTLVHAPPSTHHRPPQWEHYIISASRQQHTTKEEEDINTPMSSRRRPTTRDAETKRAGKQKKTKKPTSPRSRSSTQRTNPLATPSSTSAPTSAGSTSSPRRPTKNADAASPRSATQPPHPERPRRLSSSSARQTMLPPQPLEEVRPPSISTVASWEHTASPHDDLPPPSPGAPSSSSTPTSQSKAAKEANDVIAEDVKPGHAHRRHRTRKHAHRAPSTSSSVSDHAVMADVGSRRSKRSQHVEEKLTEASTPDEHLRLTATTASPSSSSSPRHMHHRRRRHRSKASQTTTKRQSSASSLPASRSRASSSSSSDDDDDHHPVSSQKKRLMERSNHNPLLAFVRSYVEMDPVAEIRSARHKSHRQPHRRGDEEEENDHAQHNATQLEPKPAGKKHRRRRRRVPSSPSSVDVDDDPKTPRRMSRTCSPPHATSFPSSATPRSRSATASPPSAPRVNDDHHHRRRRRTQRPHSSRSRRDASLQWSAHSSKSNISRSTISSRSSSPSPSCHDASTQWSAPVSSSSSDHVHNEAPRKVVGPRIKMHAKKLQWTTSPSKQSRRAHMHNPSTQHAARRSSPRGEVGNEEIDHPQHHPTQPTKKKRIKKRRAKDASASPRSREEATQYSARVSPHTFDRSSSRGDEYNAWSARTSPLSSNSSHSPLRRARERRRYHDGRRSARTSPKEHLLIHHHHQQQKQRRRISSSRAGSSSSSSSDASQRGPYFVYHSRAQLRRVGGASRNGRGGGRYHRPHPRQVVANTQNVWARLSASSHAPTIRRRVAHATLRPFYTGALAVPPSTKMAVVHDEVRSPRKSPLPGCVVGGRRRGDVGVGAASPRGRVHHQVVKRKVGAAEDRHHGAAPLVKDEGSATSSPRPLLRISKRSLAMYRPYFHAPPMPAAMRLQHPSRPLRRQSKRRGEASRRMRVPAAPTSSSPHKMAHKSRAKMRMEEEVDPYEHLLRRHGFWGETNSAMLVL